MFCPKCAEQNLDDAKFCRACGANVALVPQALSGSLPTAANTERHASGVKYTIISLGLLAVAVTVLLVAPPHDGWVFFFLAAIAAVIIFGVAVGEFVAAGHGRAHAQAHDRATAELAPPDTRAAALPPARETADMIRQPASVAEGTTRNLAAVPRAARGRDRER